MHILFILTMMGLGLLFPKGMKFLVAAPLFGIAAGGVGWAIVATIVNSLITLHAFGLFLLSGVLLAEVLALFDTN
jgi:hypothetical protein